MNSRLRAKHVLRGLLRRTAAARTAFLAEQNTRPAQSSSGRPQPVQAVDATNAGTPGTGQPVPQPTSRPGSRKTSSFFDDYTRFYETSKTTPYPWRLNLRYEAIMAENADILQGARVLDIASHDGRWSFAALKAGAASVVGIEARPDLIENAEQNMRHYGISSERYRFVHGDVFDVMAREEFDVDVVLCLGFFYHTLRWSELMHRIRQCSPRNLIIDTSATANATRPIVTIRTEDIAPQRNAVADEFSHGTLVMSGAPSVPALDVIARAYGFTADRLSDWPGLVRDNPDADKVNDYRDGRRVTLRCSAG